MQTTVKMSVPTRIRRDCFVYCDRLMRVIERLNRTGDTMAYSDAAAEIGVIPDAKSYKGHNTTRELSAVINMVAIARPDLDYAVFVERVSGKPGKGINNMPRMVVDAT